MSEPINPAPEQPPAPPELPPIVPQPIEDDPSDDRGNRELYQGNAYGGGPLDGEHLVSRYPKGVVAIDRPGNRAWIYDYQPEAPATEGTPVQFAQFDCRDAAGMDLDEEARWETAEGADYDIVAVG